MANTTENTTRPLTMKDFFKEENGEIVPIDESVLIDFKDGDIVVSISGIRIDGGCSRCYSFTAVVFHNRWSRRCCLRSTIYRCSAVSW